MAVKFTKHAVKEAVATIKELDKELTEQAMVTGMTREETYSLMKTYQELALATGATTKEIASVATEYIKQGKSIKEATLLNKISEAKDRLKSPEAMLAEAGNDYLLKTYAKVYQEYHRYLYTYLQ